MINYLLPLMQIKCVGQIYSRIRYIHKNVNCLRSMYLFMHRLRRECDSEENGIWISKVTNWQLGSHTGWQFLLPYSVRINLSLFHPTNSGYVLKLSRRHKIN